jgi:DNA-binding PadR family transcriptional regulator
MAATGKKPESMLPLKELDRLVLLALDGEPQHGYRLLTRVAERSGGFVAPGPASLYRVLADLETAGVLEEAEGYAATDSEDARRKYFRLTSFGRAVLRAELGRLAALLASARGQGIRFEGGPR